MLDELIKKIYEMKFGTIITPQNLMENAKLKNFNYVKYEKDEYVNEMIVEMECLCDDNILRVFKYFFDSDDKLRRITTNSLTDDILFDRDEELRLLIAEFKKGNSFFTPCVAS